MKILDEHLVGEGTDYGKAGSLSLFQKFINREDLEDITELLKAHDIPFRAKEKTAIIDSIIIGDALDANFSLEIPASEFVKVNALLEKEAKDNLKSEDLDNHYLSELSDGELIEVLEKPDEWNQDAIFIAKMLLEKRGVEVDEHKIKNTVEARLNQIKEPKKGNIIWQIFWLLLGAISGFLFWPLGFIASFGMGIYYSFFKSTAPDGNKYFEFDEGTRKFGYTILSLTIVFVLIGLFLQMNYNVYEMF